MIWERRRQSCLTARRHRRRRAPVPSERQIRASDHVRQGVSAGELLPARPIPSENQLVQEYGVARGTARKSIQLLRERGLVVTVVGRGTFVESQRQAPGTERPAIRREQAGTCYPHSVAAWVTVGRSPVS